MKIKSGLLPDFSAERDRQLRSDGWRPLREPQDIKGYLVLSLPLIIGNLLVSQLIVGAFIPPGLTIRIKIAGFIGLAKSLLILMMMVIVLIILHEFVHLLLVPNFLHSDQTYLGFVPFGGYVYTEQVLSKRRMLLIMVAPYIFFSVIINSILGYLGLYNNLILFFILLNSIGSSVDILGAVLILFQVPGDARLVNNGLRTYYKRSLS